MVASSLPNKYSATTENKNTNTKKTLVNFEYILASFAYCGSLPPWYFRVFFSQRPV